MPHRDEGETRTDAPSAAIVPGDPSDGVGARSPDDSGTRQRILDAAAEVFREKGFTGTRVVDIARRAGYTSGALYGYFENRAELLAEAIASSSTDMLDRHLQSLEEGSDASDLVDATIAELARPLDEADQMLLDGVALAHREPVAGDRLAATLGRFRSEVVDHGTVAPASADLVVILMLGVTAARALGLHDLPPDELTSRLSDALATRSATEPAVGRTADRA